jgi:molybdate transport system ATP-binding protein
MSTPTARLAHPPCEPRPNILSPDPRALQVYLRKDHAAGLSSQFRLETKFTVSPGVTVIVGHSGAGKTTILHCIAGLSHPDEGRIAVGDRVLFDSAQKIRIEPARRRIAFVFQDLALFPHLSVEDNVMYGLRRLDKAERQRRMREVLESFQIEHLCRRFPRETSGGEQQRVALARSLVTEPSVLLLDEPLSSLDPRTKVRIIEDLRKWNDRHRIPVLYVTHDHGEVFALGDRVIELEQGKIVTEGLPPEVIPFHGRSHPRQKTEFANLFDATVVELRTQERTMVCQLTGTSVEIETPLSQAAVGSEVCVGIQASEILLASERPSILSDCNVIQGKIKRLEPVGDIVEARVGCGAEFRVHVSSRLAKSSNLQIADEAWMMIRAQDCQVVAPAIAETLRRLVVFVCHGNTIRSPIAQAVCNAEIATRYGLSADSLDELGIKAMSAGLTAHPGEPLAAEAKRALRAIGMPIIEHRSRNLTRGLAQRAEIIFCMTRAQREEVIAMYPASMMKTECLDPNGDIEDPKGSTLEVFLSCAERIRDLVRLRFDQLGLHELG